MDAGQMVAYNQFVMQGKCCEGKCEDTAQTTGSKKVKLKAKNDKKGGTLTVGNERFSIVFDNTTGLIRQWVVDGRQQLAEGGTILPNFWRAPTDNDMGAQIHRKYAVWRNPARQLTSLGYDKKNCRVTATYDMPDVKATLTMTYTLAADGEMQVGQELKTTPDAKVSNMMRFGIIVQLPYQMDRSEYFGRGPVENYADRKFSQLLGHYKQTADEQFYPYVRPQETGTKSDMRWWRQTTADGSGLAVSSCCPFYASALHYNIADLDDGDDKEQRHAPQVPRSTFTNLFLDAEHTGVGGVDSWSGNAEALKPYRVLYGDKKLSLSLKPLK